MYILNCRLFFPCGFVHAADHLCVSLHRLYEQILACIFHLSFFVLHFVETKELRHKYTILICMNVSYTTALKNNVYGIKHHFLEMNGGIYKWCGWSDSNRHSFRNQILSLARLPVPPHPHTVIEQIFSLSSCTI